MADELFDTLLRFHREFIQPEFDRLQSRMDGMATRDELNARRDELLAMNGTTRDELLAVNGATRNELQAMRKEMVTWPTLMRFHNEVVHPELDEFRAEIRSKLEGMATRDEVLSYMDDIYQRFDRIESEYQSINAAVRRIELNMKEQGVDRGAVRSELVEIKAQISELTQRVDELEKDLN